MDKSKWGYKKLGEVATFLNGYAFKPSEWNSEGLPIIRIQNLTNTNAEYNYFNGDNIDKRYIVNNGDLLVSWSATLGAFIWDGDKAILNQHIFKTIFDKTDIDKHFLRYSIISSLNLMSTKAHGITMRHITKKDFDNIKIRVPPLSDQHHIVSELDKLSDIISLKQQQMKEYDALIESVFYDMFGESIRENKLQIKTIGELATDVKYGTSKAGGTEGIFKYLRMNNLTNDGYLDLNDIKYIDLSDEEVEKYVVRKGDVLFNRTNSRERVGKTALFDQEEEMVIAGYIIRVRLNNEISPVYLVRYMNLPYMKKVLRKLAKGAVGQANINAQQMKTIEVPLPPLSLQRSFAEKVKAIEHQKSLLKQSIAKTQTLLDSRMQEYFG